MNMPHMHLLLNHLPIIGMLITLGVYFVALAGQRDDLKQTCLTLFALIALAAIPTFITGSGAQDAIKDSPDISMDLILAHQGAALLAFIFMEITGAISLFAVWRFSRPEKDRWVSRPARGYLLTVFVFAVISAGLMAVAGNTGGAIRHPEISGGQDPTSMIGAMGASLILSLQHFVIDSSMWVWPILEDLHFIGLILLIGSIGVVNLRILGFLKRLPLGPLNRFVPWAVGGFIVNVITGFLFFVGMPGFYTVNVVFQLKILTIFVAATLLLIFNCTSASRILENVGPGEEAPPLAKVIAVASICLWIAVIILGRYIPFGEVT
jgi:hypothetical protein